MAGWDDDHWQDGRGTWMLSWKVQEIKIIYECARTKKNKIVVPLGSHYSKTCTQPSSDSLAKEPVAWSPGLGLLVTWLTKPFGVW